MPHRSLPVRLARPGDPLRAGALLSETLGQNVPACNWSRSARQPLTTRTWGSGLACDPPRLSPLLRLAKQLLGLREQIWNVVLDHVPDAVVFDDVVAMDENVAESDDLFVRAETPGGVSVDTSEAIDGLPDHLKITLDG